MDTQAPKRSDFVSLDAYREALTKHNAELYKARVAAEKARIASELENDKGRAEAFKAELNALLAKHKVDITETSDEGSDWYGITGFYLGFRFHGCHVVWKLDD